MSTGSDEGRVGRVTLRETDGWAAVVFPALFVVLLAMAVIWPRPVLWINDLTLRADLRVSTVSFLGREAPSWDVVYWAIVGIAALAMFHGRIAAAVDSWVVMREELSGVRSRSAALLEQLRCTSTLIVAVGVVLLAVAAWLLVDASLMAQVSRIGAPRVHDFVRLSNRLGGGGNPPMVIGFFVLAGLALRRPRWTLLGFAMLTSAGAAGLLAGILKPLVARTRPDLWLGPFNRVWGGESSFPSGHTISAFAMAGAVIGGSRSTTLRVTVLLAAISVATTRVIALRHWPSDVLVSAMLGMAFGVFAGRVFVRRNESDVEITEVDRHEA